jgi:hypothetical protein
MNHIDSRRAFNESARSISLANVPTVQQMHDVCWKCAQMAADFFEGRVAVALPDGINVIREPTRGRAA